MTLTNEPEPFVVCQATQHGMLIPWGRFAGHLRLSERLRTAVPPRHHKDAQSGGDLILEFGLASLAGCAYLEELNLGAHPLVKDEAVQDAWDVQLRHYTTVSRYLYDLDTAAAAQVQAELEAIMVPYIRQATHEVLCHQEYLTLCGDLTGRPVSAYSTTYPPDAVFGYRANQLCKGHQAALVSLKGLRHRVHVAVFHHPGDTVSGPCLAEMVVATEARLGCRPRRRTELVRQRIERVEAQIRQKQAWIEAQRATIRAQVERQLELGQQLQALRQRLTELEASYAGKKVRPTSRLAQARQRKSSWERQLGAALAQENQACRAIEQHQPRLEALITERARLITWLAQLEVDNATCPNPVCIRWLLDGGFGDAANVTYLIERGYDLYAMAHNGKTTQALLKQVPNDATWIQVGVRTQALDSQHHILGDCPCPVRLTLLRWSGGSKGFRYSTLISFSETETLPTAGLFPTYHQRQDVEAGIKQGKGTFSFTKLHVRSPAGIRLLGQFALFFWPNFVHWAADWLAERLSDRFVQVLSLVRTQVRVAANTPAVVLTHTRGQLLEFANDGPYPGVQIRLDGPFAYQFPMPLFQTWTHLWPVSSESVKEQLVTITVTKSLPSLAEVLFSQITVPRLEKVSNFELTERLPP
ncbi:MAG: hypothetical protein KJ077_51410 [Anaerolineae bacterium]|nr:hypothetical protein [Anaerolineae bacterium]